MEAERGLVGRIGCKIVSLREDIDGLHHELAELGQLQDSLSSSRTVRTIAGRMPPAQIVSFPTAYPCPST